MADDVITKRARAVRAQQLLDDEVLNLALGSMEGAAVDAIASCPLTDTLALQSRAADLQAVRAFRGHLRSLVTTGDYSREPGIKVA